MQASALPPPPPRLAKGDSLRKTGIRSRISCSEVIRRSAASDKLALPGVGLRHLANQLGPIHIHRSIDSTGRGPTVVFENLDHQRRVVR